MITFEPFWSMLKKRGISTYSLELQYSMNKSIIDRLRKDHNMTLHSIDYLCETFDCRIEDVLVFRSNKEER